MYIDYLSFLYKVCALFGVCMYVIRGTVHGTNDITVTLLFGN